MEPTGDEMFKFIPVRCYFGDEPFSQRLVKPVLEEGQQKTLRHLLHELYPDTNFSK